jgi:hypothetical protein
MENSAQTRRGPSNQARTRRSSEFRAQGSQSWSPLNSGSTYDSDEDRYWLDREITLLERALGDNGEMRRRDLGEVVGCKYWGPRRYARALKAATEQGRIKRTSYGRYGPAS